MGNINSSGCYELCDVVWACCDGAGGVTLSAITSINGLPPDASSGGTPPGPPNMSVQWNNNGLFGGDPNFTWNSTNSALNITGIVGINQVNTFGGWDGRLCITENTRHPMIHLTGGRPGNDNYCTIVFSGVQSGTPALLWEVGTDPNEFGNGDFQIASRGAGNAMFYIDFLNGNIGLGTQYPAYACDINGDANATGCYRINGVPFACYDATSGGIDLSNVTNINGAPPGTGSGPAGVNRDVQFNNAGAFGASNTFVYTAAGNLGVGTNNPEVAIQTTGGILTTGIPPSWPDIGPGLMIYSDPVNGGAIYSYNFGPNTATDLNIYAHNLVGNVTTSAFSGRMGIGKTPGANYALDVNGNVTASGCYYILNVPFACLDSNGTTVDLRNIASINGSAPSSGQMQTPWLSDINGANYNLTSVATVNIGFNAPVNNNAAISITPSGTVSTGIQIMGPGVFDALNQNNGNSGQWAGITLTSDSSRILAIRMNGSARSPNTAQIFYTGSDLTFWNGNTAERARLTQAGRLGIGTAAPGYPVDVVGDVNSTGCYRINGNAYACSAGGSGVNLSNITNINGSAYLPTGLWSQGSAGAIYYNGGNVGVGTSTPGASFHAYRTDGGYQYILEGNAGGTDHSFGLAIASGTGSFLINDATLGVNRMAIGTSGEMSFGTAMYINSSGSVGIGTSSPAYTLDINGDCNIATGHVYRIGGIPLNVTGLWSAGSGGAIYYNGGNVGIGNTAAVVPDASPSVFLIVGPTTTAAPYFGEVVMCGNTTGVNGQTVGVLDFANYALTTTDKRIGAILVATDGATNSGAMLFYSWNAGSAAERMRITSAGNVGIGTTSPAGQLTISNSGAQGFEFFSHDNVGGSTGCYFQVYDRSAGVFKTCEQQASAHYFMGGNVGIGTRSPLNLFQVHGAPDQNIALRSSAGWASIGTFNDAGTAAIPLNMDASIFYLSTGNVGIHTANPGSVLTVGNATINWAHGQFEVDGGRSYLYAASEPFAIGMAYSTSSTGGTYIGTDSNGNFQVSNSGGSPILLISPAGGVYAQPSGGFCTYGAGLIANSVNVSGNYYINGVPIGPTTITNVTGSRAANGTVYQNTTGKLLFVSATINSYGSGSGSNIAYSDGANPPGTQVAIFGQAVTATANQFVATLHFIVLPGNFYRVYANSVADWIEWY